jgi:nucleotide-binding universal stress UspA family protein
VNRHEVLRVAERALATAKLPDGTQAVVVVTDWTGNWVGVAANVPNDRVKALLESALDGSDRQDAKAIDVDGGAL